ncbi:unnamed protein product [Discosporangium mesarthrocarpum]
MPIIDGLAHQGCVSCRFLRVRYLLPVTFDESSIVTVISVTDEEGQSVVSDFFLRCEAFLLEGDEEAPGAVVATRRVKVATQMWKGTKICLPRYAVPLGSRFAIRVSDDEELRREHYSDMEEAGVAIIAPVVSAPLGPDHRNSEPYGPAGTRLWCLRHFSFPFDVRSGNTVVPNVRVTIREEYGLSIGSHVWDSSIVLSNYLSSLHAIHPLWGKGGGTSLELGSGCGLVGLCLAALGCRRVVLTDRMRLLPLLRENIRLNDGDGKVVVTEFVLGGSDESFLSTDKRSGNNTEPISLAVSAKGGRSLGWTATEEGGRQTESGSFDLVLAADILYSREAVPALLDALDRCCSVDTLALLAQKRRNKNGIDILEDGTPCTWHMFLAMARKRGFNVRELGAHANVEMVTLKKQTSRGPHAKEHQ